MLFVCFERGSPAVLKGIRNRSSVVLSSSKLFERRTFSIEFTDLRLHWPPTHFPVREVTVAQVLLQSGFSDIVGRLLE